MNDSDRLWQAILDDPYSDELRLIYADTIEEEQPDKATFIRLQIDLAKMEPCECERTAQRPFPEYVHLEGFHCDWCRKREQEKELLVEYYRVWIQEYGLQTFKIRDNEGKDFYYGWNFSTGAYPGSSVINCHVIYVQFYNGLASKIRCSLPDFYQFNKYGKEVVKHAPITQVRFEGKMPAHVRHKARGKGRQWCWFADQVPPEFGLQLPQWSYRLNNPHVLPKEWMPKRRVNFDSDENAYKFASEQALKWARSK